MIPICHVYEGESTGTNVQFLCTRTLCNLSNFNPMAPNRSKQEMAAQSFEQGKFHMQKELQQGNNIYKCVKRTLKNTRGLSETAQGKNTWNRALPQSQGLDFVREAVAAHSLRDREVVLQVVLPRAIQRERDTENLIASSSCLEGAMENNHLWCKQTRMKS